jgi:hypothetical protein
MELTIMFGLMVKHTLADYFFQYSWMIKDKGNYGAWKGMAHSEFHGLLTWVVLTICGIGWPLALALSLADAFIHYHIDFIKSNFWKSKQLGPQDQLYWVTHGVDQFAHFLTYIGIVLLCVS